MEGKHTAYLVLGEKERVTEGEKEGGADTLYNMTHAFRGQNFVL